MDTNIAAQEPESEAKEAVLLPINTVERETGVSKELLRMWERRYQFPNPERDTQGDRVYSADQVNKLRLIRRLLDAGFRPGKIINHDISTLEEMISSSSNNLGTALPDNLGAELLTMLKSRDPRHIREYLTHQLIRMGLESFIFDLVQYANVVVGDAWMSGKIEVYEEHLYTEEVQMLIRHNIGNLQSASAPPRIMLTTAPEELHTLGILMIEAILRLDKINAISFGAQMAIRDIVQATQKHKMDVVALSFSSAYSISRAAEFLEELRFRLPMAIQIWAGGGGITNGRRRIEGVKILNDLSSVRQAAIQWRQDKGVNEV